MLCIELFNMHTENNKTTTDREVGSGFIVEKNPLNVASNGNCILQENDIL